MYFNASFPSPAFSSRTVSQSSDLQPAAGLVSSNSALLPCQQRFVAFDFEADTDIEVSSWTHFRGCRRAARARRGAARRGEARRSTRDSRCVNASFTLRQPLKTRSTNFPRGLYYKSRTPNTEGHALAPPHEITAFERRRWIARARGIHLP